MCSANVMQCSLVLFFYSSMLSRHFATLSHSAPHLCETRHHNIPNTVTTKRGLHNCTFLHIRVECDRYEPDLSFLSQPRYRRETEEASRDQITNTSPYLNLSARILIKRAPVFSVRSSSLEKRETFLHFTRSFISQRVRDSVANGES